MDHKFTEQIRLWLETPDAERDYTVGALYLLKLSGNQIMYRNIISQINHRHDDHMLTPDLSLGYSFNDESQISIS